MSAAQRAAAAFGSAALRLEAAKFGNRLLSWLSVRRISGVDLGGDFWSAFTFTFVAGIVVSEVWQRTLRRARPGAATESAAPEDQDELVARLASESRPGDRASRLLDQYEVAIQDRLLLHYLAKDEQSAERKSALDASSQRMRLRQSAARSMVTQELLGATANPEKL